MTPCRVNRAIYNLDAVRKVTQCANGDVVFHYADHLVSSDIFRGRVARELWDRLCREADLHVVIIDGGTTEDTANHEHVEAAGPCAPGCHPDGDGRRRLAPQGDGAAHRPAV